VTDLATTLRAGLAAVADSGQAPGMQAYMKSAMPYLGISAVPMRAVCKAVFAGLSWDDPAAWQRDVLAIWRGARFREERHAAIELTGIRAAKDFQTIEALGLYEEMIVSGAWWDYVDVIATHRLWAIFRHDPAAMKPRMLAWANDDSMPVSSPRLPRRSSSCARRSAGRCANMPGPTPRKYRAMWRIMPGG